MCGFTGFWDFKKRYSNDVLTDIASKMSDQIVFRGPDSAGVWTDETFGLAFAHRRLAIIDLSTAGHQPMHSRSGRFVIAYNGEIYNAAEIRKQLSADGVSFVGFSDTEVLLEACECWGVERALQKTNGMFAFSLWDKAKKKLFLARDRIGIKPLYYGLRHDIFYFSSQLKPLCAHPDWQPAMNLDALTSFFRFNYIPAPFSIYKGIQKLMPGSYAVVDVHGNVQQHAYWSLNADCLSKRGSYKADSEAGVIEAFDQLLQSAVKDRMRSDVPLGAFLSGGIDSSTVVALMQHQSHCPVKTFSIGFNEKGYNEADHAKLIAAHLGTEHHELYLSSYEAMEIIPNLSQWYDEPFADSSQIPTYLVSKLAREHVTVSLSGDGGDELFAGYTRYVLGNKMYSPISKMPYFMRKQLAKGIRCLSPSAWDRAAHFIPKKFCPSHLGDKAHKFSSMLEDSGDAFYQSIVSIWNDPQALVQGGVESYVWASAEQALSYVEKMQFTDMSVYLPDDILTKVDRASMAVSLEARVPILDHRVIEFAWSLPMQYKLRGKESKWLMRRLLEKYVPSALFSRPKMGFGVPIGVWLRGPLKEWAENLMSEKKLKDAGILNAPLIRRRWEEHLSGARNWQYVLWGVLMFQSWYEQY